MNIGDKVEVRCFRDKDEEWWEGAEVIVFPHNDNSIGVRFLTTQGVNKRRLAWVAKADWRSCASVIAQQIDGAKTHERSDGSDIGPNEEGAGVEQSDGLDAVCASRPQPSARALDPSERAADGDLDALRRKGEREVDEVIRKSIWDSAEVVLQWRCFHCDAVFTDIAAAEEHFGKSEYQQPECQIDIAEYRKMEEANRRHCEEDTDLHRQIHALRSDHQTALMREEEKGYARGLKDAAGIPTEDGIAWQAGAFSTERKAVMVDGRAWYRDDHPQVSEVPVYADIREAAGAIHAKTVASMSADPLQGAVDWLLEAAPGLNAEHIGGRLMIGYNRAARLRDAAIDRKAK